MNGRPASVWGNRFLFTGREWLSDIGLYDFRNRFYQPELGRFMQPDPKQFEAGDYNLYRYCHNDPVNKSDPFGLDAEFTLMRDPYVSGENPRLSAGIMSITENGRFMGSMRVNENGFYPNRQGIPAGNYVVLPKAQDGNFKAGTPAVTSPSMRDKPGETTAGHKEGDVLIHGEEKRGEPDSRACITCGPAGLKTATDVFNRSKDSTTMKVYNGPEVSKPNEIPRALPLKTLGE
ncbi:MAG TPA: RHS repeat-associated core domain-containing protein [Chthoniobacterales bacterium]|nr:RHS repeat-associated core domain-containing protein [Chthoniobacterales bacterium]